MLPAPCARPGAWRLQSPRPKRAHLLRASTLLLALFLCPAPAPAHQSTDSPGRQGDHFSNLALTPPEAKRAASATAPSTAGPSAARVVLSLGAVAVLIVGLGWTYRRVFARQQQNSGGAGVTLVSRSLLTPRHQVLVLRAGHRLLIVGDSGHGMNLLCDVSDPAEITAMLGEAGAGETDRLRAEAFAASLDAAGDSYEPLPDGQSEPVEHPPSLASAQGEVRSLIERVRGLAGQMNHTEKSEVAG